MDYIKEVTPEKHCVVRTGTYTSSVAHINRILAEATEDFPDLDLEKVKIVHYGGIRYKGTYGLEFDVDGDVPDTYRPINHVEFTA